MKIQISRFDETVAIAEYKLAPVGFWYASEWLRGRSFDIPTLVLDAMEGDFEDGRFSGSIWENVEEWTWSPVSVPSLR
jgi:hypothetical protein